MISSQKQNAVVPMTAATGEHRPDDAVLLVVPGGPADEDPERVEPAHRAEPGQERGEHPDERDEDRQRHRVRPVLDLRADPQPRHRDRPPERRGDDPHDREERPGEQGVAAAPAAAAALGHGPVAHRGRAGPPADEQPAVVGWVGAHACRQG
jgi:hypothetical protein